MNARTALALLALAAPLSAALRLQAPAAQAPSVGMPARLGDLVLPGTELEVLATDSRAAVAARIVVARPHGDAFRYDIEYWGLEPGEHDLRPLLRRKDGSTTDDLPPIPVSVRSVLPQGLVKPHAPENAPLPGLGGYQLLLIAGGVVWVAGLGWIVLSGRKRRQTARGAAPRARTLAERLRPLVERAVRGELSREERAQLELSLVALWRRRLRLEEQRPSEVLAILRAHAEAGPLLTKLEEWLHQPEPEREVDLNALLAPYRELSEDALEPASAGRKA